MGHFKDSIRGVSWMGAIRVISRVVAFFKIAILARLLIPAHFGVYGIATITLAFLETLTTTGINVFLIQEEKKLEEYIDSAWAVSIIRGVLIALIIIIFTPIIVFFFNAPDARTLLMLIAMVALIRGFINPSRVRFQKDLEFNKEFWFIFSILLLDSTVVVVLAYILRSPISMVWGLVAGAVLEVVLSFMFIKPRPRLSLDTQKVKEIVGRGKWVTASRIFSYLFQQGDDAVVGKVLGTYSLGIYQVAYKISTLPITEITQVANKVTFPIYSKIAGDINRLRKAYFKTVISISVVIIPLGLVLLLFPKIIVFLLLGQNWMEAVPVLRILSIFGIVRAISHSSTVLFLSVKKQEYVTVITLVSIFGLGLSIIPLISIYGLVGAGMSVLFGSLISLPVIFYFLKIVFKDNHGKKR